MEFFIYKDNRQQGPFTPEQLREAGISSETLVWREGMAQWTPAWQVDELRDILAGRQASAPVPPPVPPTADNSQSAEEPETDSVKEEELRRNTAAKPADRRRHRAIMWLAAAAIVFFAMLMTCPSEEKHTLAVTDEVMTALTDSDRTISTGNRAIDMIGGVIGQQIARQFIGAMVTQVITVDNYVIFSVGSISYGGESKTVSFGILGHVFTFGSDKLREMMDKDTPVPDTMAL